MAARETQHHSLPVVDFFSADSSSRGEERERESSAFQQALKPPLPSALSLRTRESSALALKHIFDQIYSSADSNPNSSNISNSTGISRAYEKRDHIDTHALNRDASNAAFQGARNQVSPSGWQVNSIPEDHRICVPEIDSPFAKAQPQGFPTNNLVVGSSPSAPTLLQNGQFPPYHTGLPQAVSRPSPTSPSMRQPTAQLTIFYSGTVNVYDDVPADKANAIMLLAGTGNSWSMKPASEGEKERPLAKLSSPSPPPHMGGPLPSAVAMTGSPGATTATVIPGKTMSFNLPPSPNMATNTMANSVSTPPISSPAPNLPMEPKMQAAPKRPHAGIELPHARKASLARFLEKRKDRVQVKQQTEVNPQGDEKGEISRDERPCSPKKPCLTGLSSSPTFK